MLILSSLTRIKLKTIFHYFYLNMANENHESPKDLAAPPPLSLPTHKTDSKTFTTGFVTT